MPDESGGSPGETGSTPLGVTRYRKKPVVIDARLFDVPPDCLPIALGIELARWCGGQFMAQLAGLADPRIEIPTLEGVMTARLGDWIIRGTVGEFYPCRADIFAETYEPADSPGDQVTVSWDDLRTVLVYARQFDVDDDPAMIRLSAAVEAGK